MRESSERDLIPRKPFRRRRRGQSLIEYTLLLAALCLLCFALMSNAGNLSQGIWSTANSQLDRANSSLTPATQGGGGQHDGHGGDGHGDHGSDGH